MNFKPGDKLDLETIDPQGEKKRQERRKNEKEYVRSYREIIPDIESAMIHNISLVQKKMSSYEGAPKDLIDSRGKINEYAFSDIYSKASIDFDKKIAHEKKKGHYNTFEPEVQERYGTSDQDKLVEIIENDEKEKMRDGGISEDLLFLIMNKVAGDRYICLKTSDYDDFENGVDMVLVDTETNDVICTFDATVSGHNSHMDKKIKRAQGRVDQGKGLYMKYGVSFNENKEMKLGEIQNIPPLFLDLNKKDLERVLHIMDFTIDSELSNIETSILSDLLDKLDSQIEDLDSRTAKNISYDSSREFVNHIRFNLDFVQSKKAA